jgi:hypothetical protein
MTTGQMIMTTGALVLLGTTVLTVNRNNINQGTILRQTEIGIYAVSLATSYVEKASAFNYDEATVGNFITNGVTTTLTSPSLLGPDTSHVGPYGKEKANIDSTFDDFDDYNGFAHCDTVKEADVFTTNIAVHYCDTTGTIYPNTGSTKTFYKRMDVMTWGSVSRSAFEGTEVNGTGVDTIKLSYIFSYIYRI